MYTAVKTSNSASDGVLGGYMYSGIGGSASGSRDGPSNATGVAPFTGDGSHVSVWRVCGLLGTLAAFLR